MILFCDYSWNNIHQALKAAHSLTSMKSGRAIQIRIFKYTFILGYEIYQNNLFRNRQ